MDVPKAAANVAWYQFGPKPGEIGNAVIAGHLDWYDGPAVFYKLNELQEGDTIVVTDDNGQEYRFTITKKATYPLDLFPMDEVFGSHEKPRLNLITCDGAFDENSKNYSHRVVIYAELDQEEFSEEG